MGSGQYFFIYAQTRKSVEKCGGLCLSEERASTGDFMLWLQSLVGFFRVRSGIDDIKWYCATIL